MRVKIDAVVTSSCSEPLFRLNSGVCVDEVDCHQFASIFTRIKSMCLLIASSACGKRVKIDAHNEAEATSSPPVGLVARQD